MVIIALVPSVNAIAAVSRGQKMPLYTMISFASMFLGVALTVQSKNVFLPPEGIFWAMVAVIACGTAFELWSREPLTPAATKCFWAATSMIVMTVPLMVAAQTKISVDVYVSPHTLYPLLFFGIIGGFVYLTLSIVPFNRLPATEAAILIQGSTPASLIGAHFIAHESMNWIQWVGAGFVITGATILSYWLARVKKPEQTIVTSASA